MVVLNKLQIRQMKKLNEKIWKGKSAEECQLWLEHNPETFELLKNEQTLDSEENYFYSPVHKAVYEQRYVVIVNIGCKIHIFVSNSTIFINEIA